ncbi:MAG TPA: NUDIX domain-containing protein [Candidatus Saccharimonadales bacterium]|nr:NUDIX domain-containing protein [Candidatus Saccharimonadales bacterium]
MSEIFRAPHVTRSGELLDIVDEYGEPTGRVLDKKTIHEQGLLHRDVHVWVTDGHALLEQQRRWDKSIMPGQWDISVGGHVGVSESFLSAAVRETHEELGLSLQAEQFKHAGLVASKLLLEGWGQPHNVIGDNFVVVMPGLTLDELQLQEEEVVDARWYPIDRLESDLAHPETAKLHAPQPRELWALGIAAMRAATA